MQPFTYSPSAHSITPARESRRPESFTRQHFATVTAVAHTVGYAETAVLSRALKVRTGVSPRAFIRRERHAAAANR